MNIFYREKSIGDYLPRNVFFSQIRNVVTVPISWIVKYVNSNSICYCLVAKWCPTLCDPMDHSTPCPQCPPLSPEVCPNLYLFHLWHYLTFSSSALPFFFCLQFFPTSGYFPVSSSLLIKRPNIWVSALVSVLLKNSQGWLLPYNQALFPLCCMGSFLMGSKPLAVHVYLRACWYLFSIDRFKNY